MGEEVKRGRTEKKCWKIQEVGRGVERRGERKGQKNGAKLVALFRVKEWGRGKKSNKLNY